MVLAVCRADATPTPTSRLQSEHGHFARSCVAYVRCARALARAIMSRGHHLPSVYYENVIVVVDAWRPERSRSLGPVRCRPVPARRADRTGAFAQIALPISIDLSRTSDRTCAVRARACMCMHMRSQTGCACCCAATIPFDGNFMASLTVAHEQRATSLLRAHSAPHASRIYSDIIRRSLRAHGDGIVFTRRTRRTRWLISPR